jgi:serine protease AprX
LLQKDGSASPDTVKTRLMRTARRNFPAVPVAVTDIATGNTYEVRHDVFTVGAGYLDVWAALNSKDVAASQALSATATLREGSVVLTGSVVFPGNIIWGGEDVISANNIIWGGDAEAGTNALRILLNGER